MSNIDSCIFCDKSFNSIESSVEHIIPDFLGGKTTIRCVCKTCNSNLGTYVDAMLKGSTYIKFVNLLVHDADTGEILNKFDFRDKSGHHTPIRSREENDPEMPEYYIGDKPDVDIVRIDDRVTVTVKHGSDRASIAKTIYRQLKKKGLPEDKEWIDKYVAEGLKLNLDQEEISTNLALSQDNFVPCVIKMTYEFARVLLGEEYDEDYIGKQYREFLQGRINGKKPEVINPITSKDHFIPVEWQASHTAKFFNGSDDQLWINIDLFGAVEFKNLITENRSMYRVPDLCYYDAQEATRAWKAENGVVES